MKSAQLGAARSDTFSLHEDEPITVQAHNHPRGAALIGRSMALGVHTSDPANHRAAAHRRRLEHEPNIYQGFRVLRELQTLHA